MNITELAAMQRPLQQIQGAASLAGANLGQESRLREACNDFEAIFIKQMLKSMRQTIDKGGLMDGGFAQETYEDMLDDEYAKKIAGAARLGVADMLYRQLSQGVNTVK